MAEALERFASPAVRSRARDERCFLLSERMRLLGEQLQRFCEPIDGLLRSALLD